MHVLEALDGEVVSGVCFVTDYVEIHFNGAILRCIAHPLLGDGDNWLRFPSAGSRDALCSLIGDVVSTTEESHEALSVRFVSRRELKVSLDPADIRGGEWAHFVPSDGRPMVVW